MNRDVKNVLHTIEENTRRIGSILVTRLNLLESEKLLVSENRWAFMKHHHDLYVAEKIITDNFLKIREDLPPDANKKLFESFTSAAGIGVAIDTATLGLEETKRRIDCYKKALNVLVDLTGTPHQVGA